MFKLNKELKVGMRIKLPEKWHKKILDFLGVTFFPYDFIIDRIEKNKEQKKIYCICRTENKTDRIYDIILMEFAAKYILGVEEEDQNVGLSFADYLPSENSKILITNERNPSDVVPGILTLQVGLAGFKGKSYISLGFIIDYMNGDGFTSVNYYSTGNKKATWKLLLHPDTPYMTDYEKMFCDTVIHKEQIKKSCFKLAAYLKKVGAVEHAKQLIERAKVHDDSKISCVEELRALSSIINDKTTLVDSNALLTNIKQEAIELHWKHNTHHPEHFKSPVDMSRLDIMEMCCDWHARSSQYNTPFLEFVKERQNNRFHFPDWMFAEIWHYCEILDS